MRAERLYTTGGAEIVGPLLLMPQMFRDERGWFTETWNASTFGQLLEADGQGAAPAFVQDNQSCSHQGVLRGLHYQLPPHAQGKLVRCVAGSITDVAVDIRRSSPTFGQSISVMLSADNRRQLWIPAGFAHGFLSLSDNTEVLYKTTDFWNRGSERAIRWNDPELAIDWGSEPNPLLAQKDAEAPDLVQAVSEGEVFA
jgi:dTDP-4-dehydrorhamnose 3,5-epimerase